MSKYKAQRTSTDGYSFASKLESSVYQILKLREKAGEIDSIRVQEHVKVCGPIGHMCDSKTRIEYVVDFVCDLSDGHRLYVEAKGLRMPVFNLKRRLWMHYSIGVLEIWGGHHSRPTLLETI